MTALKFVDTHNLVAFLEKPTGSEDFIEIVDFLNASHIMYALTVNPTIYVSHIEQFWSTAKVKTLNNGEQEIHALVDGKTKVVTKAYVRRLLKLADADVADEAEFTNVDVRHGGAATTISSLDELMETCTSLQRTVLDLKKKTQEQAAEIISLKETIAGQAAEIIGLKERVKKLEQSKHIAKEASLGEKDASKQRRSMCIEEQVQEEGSADEKVVEESFGIFSAARVLTDAREVNTAGVIFTTADTPVSTAGVSAAATTTTTIPRQKGVVFQEPIHQRVTIRIQADQEEARRLQAQFDEEDIVAREKAAKEELENLAFIQAEWENVQVKVETDYEYAKRLQAEEIENLNEKERENI
ncbi:hypothetical protein Tco_0679834 [Tanacetum coccineum]|uniref:Xylulose kinase-1 n=1 Tax=Tanacetum coccineum TaxID=301880 RepID=A0ABQ4XJQ0_9ASTR